MAITVANQFESKPPIEGTPTEPGEIVSVQANRKMISTGTATRFVVFKNTTPT
jgi:hypothetical protein